MPITAGDLLCLHDEEAQRRVLAAVNARATLVGAEQVTAGDLACLQSVGVQGKLAAALAPYGTGAMPSMADVRQVRDSIANWHNAAAAGLWLDALNHVYGPVDEVGLVLWLRADLGVTVTGSGVSSWLDQSGNGLDVSQATDEDRPPLAAMLNGQPAVEFAEGTTDRLFNADPTALGVATDSTWFVAMAHDTLAAGNQNIARKQNISGILLASNNQAGSNVGYFDGAHRSAAPAEEGEQYLTLTLDATAGEGTFRRNGSALGSVLTYDGTFMGNDDIDLYIGGAPSLTEPLGGKLAELIVYNRVLSVEEIARVEAYLAGRYEI